MTWQDRPPDPLEPRAVLAALKTASRRRRAYARMRVTAVALRASLDRCSARRSLEMQAGTEKRRSNRTEKHV